MSEILVSGYTIRSGSTRDRSLLVKFMNRTYRELYPDQDFSHLANTVEQYFSPQTPLWWVQMSGGKNITPIACLWMGTAINQVTGDRISHVFLVYVHPEHRRQGIGAALMNYGEKWTKTRGDRQISLQVFTNNKPALSLYEKLGYQPQSLGLVKQL